MLVMAVSAMAAEIDQKEYPVCQNPGGTITVEVTNCSHEAGAYFRGVHQRHHLHDPNGWTQFNEDDIMGIRDMYDYEGEIWFKVPIIGDRYYGLHELMTHPNLGSGD